MILQALNQYYQRLQEDPKTNAPEFGFGNQGVHFCLLLDRKGNLVGQPMDLRDEKGRARRIKVPGPVTRSVGIASNFAWDNTGYVLGADTKGKPERTAQTHAAFQELAAAVLDEVEDEGAEALLAFLENWLPVRAGTTWPGKTWSSNSTGNPASCMTALPFARHGAATLRQIKAWKTACAS